MHKSTMHRMKWFVDHYVEGGSGKKVLDVGSYDVNGSYRRLFDQIDIQYVGLDIEAGPNVDIVMDHPYSWSSLDDGEFDYIISGQAFEHIEFPWLTIKEIYNKLKIGGCVCIIAPSSALEHRYPFDCYRYFGDGLAALAKWAGFTILDVSVAGIPERSVSQEWDSTDNDACLIAMKGTKDLLRNEVIKFPFERRYNESYNLELHYDFLYRWINENSRDEIIKNFISEHNAKVIYIYGHEYLGELLYDELHGIDNLEVAVIDDKSCIQDVKDSLLIITDLDYQRDIKLYLDKLWEKMPKYYLDDIFVINKIDKFFKYRKHIYLYGTGMMGKRMARCLAEYGIRTDGFVVSDGKRKQTVCNGIKVFVLKELENREDVGILIAVRNKFKNEIVSQLAEKGYDNYLIF